MSYLLGFIPNEKTSHEISSILRTIGSVFDGQEIPVRWNKPENYHITLQFLGNKLSIFHRLYINWKLKNFTFKQFDISISNIRLGRTRRFKGMIFLDFAQGGDDLRELRLEISNILKIKDNNQFVPHITIGRINKDLTSQEYSNLVKDIENVSKGINLSKINFGIRELSLLENKEEIYSVVKKF